MLTLLLLATCLQKDDYSGLHRAIEAYGRATSVSGTLECDSFGSKETWTFSKTKQGASILRTPYRVYSSQLGRYTIYQAFDKTYFESVIPNSLMQIEELWPFSLIGEGSPPPYFHSQAQPKKVQYAGKAAWAVGGLQVLEAKVVAYLDAANGDLLGWDESWGSSAPNRRFRVKSLRWNKPSSEPPFVLPRAARKTSLDATMYLPNGLPMPDVDLVDERGGRTTLTKLLAGQNGAVISIGAPTCGPCEASKRFAGHNLAAFKAKNLRFVALEGGSTQSQLQELAKSNPVPFRIYRPSGADDLRFRLKLAGAPTIYFVDAHRRVIYAQQGFEAKSFANALTKLHLTGLKL